MTLQEALAIMYGPLDAPEVLEDMKASVDQGEDPEEILFEHGLEPDYVFDLIEGAYGLGV